MGVYTSRCLDSLAKHTVNGDQVSSGYGSPFLLMVWAPQAFHNLTHKHCCSEHLSSSSSLPCVLQHGPNTRELNMFEKLKKMFKMVQLLVVIDVVNVVVVSSLPSSPNDDSPE